MLVEIGHFLLILAFLVTLVQGVLPLYGVLRDEKGLAAIARPASLTAAGLLLISFAILANAFLNDDFSLRYVATYSNSLLPRLYKFTAVWGGHEGSMLLWVTLLTLWAAVVAMLGRALPAHQHTLVLAVMGLIASGFLAFLLFTSNPFERLVPPAVEGRDLNPLLQDPGMAFHPPLLYMGYVGFSVAFAFALAALISGRLDAEWARWSRPWTLAAWLFLTLGIALGSYWAYYELGWGGWWFWDPVENASFMPWLVGTALIHSLAVTEKRGAFRNWTVFLALVAFSLSLLGTFLVRSGILTSVHAFATDPKRGVFILAFLAIVVGVSLALFAWRAPKVGLGGAFALFSRESLLLANNVLLVVTAAAVLLGTLYPLVLDALGLGKISVGAPYFETIFVPLMTPVAILLGLGPFTRWKEAHPSDLRPLAWALPVLVLAIFLPLVGGRLSALAVFGIILGVWVLTASLLVPIHQAQAPSGSGFEWRRVARMPIARWGMVLAHAGVGVFILGVTMVKSQEVTQEVKMGPGDAVEMAGHRFEFVAVEEVRGPNYVAARATLAVYKGDRLLTILIPEKRLYLVQRMPMTEAALDPGFLRDLYVSLGEALPDGRWIVRLQYKPLVYWIWGGCLLMALGGLCAATDRRYRRATSPAVAATGAQQG